MNLQGVSHFGRVGTNGHVLVIHRWSKCYLGRYDMGRTKVPGRISGKTKFFARWQTYNRPPRRPWNGPKGKRNTNVAHLSPATLRERLRWSSAIPPWATY